MDEPMMGRDRRAIRKPDFNFEDAISSRDSLATAPQLRYTTMRASCIACLPLNDTILSTTSGHTPRRE